MKIQNELNAENFRGFLRTLLNEAKATIANDYTHTDGNLKFLLEQWEEPTAYGLAKNRYAIKDFTKEDQKLIEETELAMREVGKLYKRNKREFRLANSAKINYSITCDENFHEDVRMAGQKAVILLAGSMTNEKFVQFLKVFNEWFDTLDKEYMQVVILDTDISPRITANMQYRAFATLSFWLRGEILYRSDDFKVISNRVKFNNELVKTIDTINMKNRKLREKRI